jgi:hypothetical protein
VPPNSAGLAEVEVLLRGDHPWLLGFSRKENPTYFFLSEEKKTFLRLDLPGIARKLIDPS